MYATIIQCRSWLPNEIGGLVWLAWDNVATSIYAPHYCSITKVPETSYTPGREKGFTKKSAWWAFNAMSSLAHQRWGDMRKDVRAVWDSWQKELFVNQKEIEVKALELYRKDKNLAVEYLSNYCFNWQVKIVDRCWQLFEDLLTKYDELY
jgi:dipeptidase